MNSLQKALKVNAVFSGISGIILLLFKRYLAELFGTTNNNVFWIVGVILIYFSATIWYEIPKQRKPAVIWIIIQDYAWVLGSIILLISNPFNLSQIGNIIIGIIALIVLSFGIHQMNCLKRSTKNNR